MPSSEESEPGARTQALRLVDGRLQNSIQISRSLPTFDSRVLIRIAAERIALKVFPNLFKILSEVQFVYFGNLFVQDQTDWPVVTE